MKFRSYVPATVREQITAMLEGDRWEPSGWDACLADAEQKLTEIEEEIATKIKRGEVKDLDTLRAQRLRVAEHRDLVADNVECLRRLSLDSRMRKVFVLLTKEFTDDQQWRDFILAAWAARIDYLKCRERLKEAAQLKGEISKTAETLAKLIRKFAETGVTGPEGFFSVPWLLRETDNHDSRGHNLHMWRNMRRHLLGDPSRGDIQEKTQEQPREIVIVAVTPGEAPARDPTEQLRDVLHYGWRTAPPLPALLDTVAKTARDFKPSEDGMIGVALKSRQKNTKTEYLRAFGHQLTDVRNFILTSTIMRAMAIVADVVINQPDVNVSYDDVRQALRG